MALAVSQPGRPAWARRRLPSASGLIGGGGVLLLVLLAIWVIVDEFLLDRAMITALVADPYRTSFRDKLLFPAQWDPKLGIHVT